MLTPAALDDDVAARLRIVASECGASPRETLSAARRAGRAGIRR